MKNETVMKKRVDILTIKKHKYNGS